MEFFERIRELYKKHNKQKALSEKDKEIKLEKLLDVASIRYSSEELKYNGRKFEEGDRRCRNNYI